MQAQFFLKLQRGHPRDLLEAVVKRGLAHVGRFSGPQVGDLLEEAISGVEDMMYFKSVAGSDGVLQMTVTFRPGTNAEDATVRVQNR
ncbi:MAG TPA: efflux RND transporter permease subunit, partial [Marinobacter sp.]|nr:efflux RND transporter permease subunit [Marinobacter sp.]